MGKVSGSSGKMHIFEEVKGELWYAIAGYDRDYHARCGD